MSTTWHTPLGPHLSNGRQYEVKRTERQDIHPHSRLPPTFALEYAVSMAQNHSVILGLAILLFAGVAVWQLVPRVANDTNIACTMEAKLCPDGSAVGRVGPNCEFAHCPDEKVDDNDDELFEKTGTFTGKVSIGPLCPVEPCTNPIPDVYSSRQLILEPRGGGRPVNLPFSVKLDANGNFSDEIPEGNYSVTLSDCNFLGCSQIFPLTVFIKANEKTEINLDVDTGIR